MMRLSTGYIPKCTTKGTFFDRPVGEICSGGLSPTLAPPGTEIAIEIRRRSFPARIEKKSLYRTPHLPSRSLPSRKPQSYFHTHTIPKHL